MNRLYNIAGNEFLKKLIDWENDDIRLALIDSTYVFNATHSTGADLGVTNVGTPQQVSSLIATADGIAAGGSVVFASLSDPRTVTYVVLLRWGTTLSNSTLLAYYDNVTGFPFIPDGNNYAIFPDATLGGFFQIGGFSC